MLAFVSAIGAYVSSLFWPQHRLGMEVLAFRHQIAILQRTNRQPRLGRWDRCLWVLLKSAWSGWRTDQMIVFNQVQLRQAVQSYFDYYHKTRRHRSLSRDCPVPRPVQLPDQGRVVEIPWIGGLHHQYLRQAA